MCTAKRILSLSVFLLCLCFAAAALAESPLAELWDSGIALLFDTDNVTVDGEASFDLEWDGAAELEEEGIIFGMNGRFKTAKLHYVQDGYNSYYGLKLLTPRKDGTERETGWIIIGQAKGESTFVYVMEALSPGKYRLGTDGLNSSLLHRSPQLDALTALGGQLTRMLEPTLPAGTVTVTRENDAKKVHISLTGDQLPDVAQSALSMGAAYLADRWFNTGHDRYSFNLTSFSSYVAPATALAEGTVRWELKQADVDFTVDGQGRLAKVNGSVWADSVFCDGEIFHVRAQFDLNVTDWGKSHVEPFDPKAYYVELAR